MANSVDLVIGSEAIKQVENLVAKLSLADAELLKISQTAASASKGISSISTPTGLDKTVQNTTALNTQLEKQNTIITKLHADIAKKAEQSRLAEIKLQQQREKAFDSFERNAQKESALADKNSNAYNKTQAQINRLTVAYNNLSLRKERYNNLSVNEEMRLATLGRVTEKYNGILKATDAQVGKNTRNVGNYASGYNGLGNSINQITRELPAFTFSAQTGFLALSNNIPILTDEIGRLIQKNKELKASGQETTSVLKQILGGVFSMATVMGIAILAFTLFGKEIGYFLKGTTEAKEAQKALNEEVEKSKFAIDKESVQLKVLTSIVNDHNKSSKDRKLAYDEIKEILPGLTSQTYENAIATGELSRVTDLYTASLIARNVVEIKSKGIAERQSALDFKMSKTTKERLTFWEKVRIEYTAQGLTYADFTRRLKAQDEAEQELINTDMKSLSVDLLKSNALESQIEKYTVNTKGIKDNSKETKEHVQLTTNSEKAIQANITAMKEHLSNIDKTSDAYALLNALIKLTEASTNLLGKSSQEIFIKPIIEDTSGEIIPPVSQNQEDQSEWLKQYAKDQEDLLAKQKEIQAYLKSFSSEFMSNSGFTETFQLLNGEIEGFGENFAVTFNAIAESAQEAFNFISNISQANFDNERKRIEDQQAIAISYAGGSAIAIAKINEDAEKRKKDIANRENKAKQKQAIFNIAIDTAQAIMATVGKTGFAGLPLALILGALGAAQIAMVASQKIPQYFDGTDNHVGGMMLVNDGAGSNYQEKVILPNGKEIMPEGRNVLMNAPKGTKVLTHEQQIMEMLNERGISMSAKYSQNNGMTAEEMDSVMGKHFSKIQINNTSFDKKGWNEWTEKNGNRTRQNANRVSRTGFRV